ncbi:MAG: bifunctional phosphoribosylaminoimidazolecarboxamide formyltransferase/IMP cyclohydrolase [Planctomycetales bacterium]
MKTLRALISVSDKTGLDSFAKALVELGFELISTGGTRKYLSDHGIPVIDISAYTGFPEIMDGRVKTLHPKVHGAILGRPDLPEDQHAIAAHGIVPFQLVVCNLYPFEATVAKPDVTIADAIENIDIGGPSMIRSSAKNHAYVGVVTSHTQFDKVLSAWREGKWTPELRRELALAAFEMTARYDRAISDYLAKITQPADETSSFPQTLNLGFKKQSDLRYGENPHQAAAFYVEPNAGPGTLAQAEQLHGKELSYNNLLDLDAAMNLVREFQLPGAVVIKHNNPCGAAVAEQLNVAFQKAYAGDPISAFGSILAFNRPVDVATAEELCVPDRFVEAIIAPSFDQAAFELLTTKPKWKANVRLLRCPTLTAERQKARDYRRVSGGLLVQDADDLPMAQADWKVVTTRQPTPEELATLVFAWGCVKHVKSNAIVFVRDQALVGVGAGQMSRLDSVHMAGFKAGDRSRGAVVASDAFFPFRDGVDECAKAGITAVIQPGGSRNDNDAIAACNEHNMAMIFTSRRHFKH